MHINFENPVLFYLICTFIDSLIDYPLEKKYNFVKNE